MCICQKNLLFGLCISQKTLLFGICICHKNLLLISFFKLLAMRIYSGLMLSNVLLQANEMRKNTQ